MNQRLDRQSLQKRRPRTQNLEDTLTMNGRHIIVWCQRDSLQDTNLQSEIKKLQSQKIWRERHLHNWLGTEFSTPKAKVCQFA